MKPRGRTWILETACERVPGGLVLTVRGRISRVTATSLADDIAAAKAESSLVVIDLEGVDYISGPGVMVLREATSGSGARAILCGLQEPVRITLALAGVLEGVSIEDTREGAIVRLAEKV